MKKLLSLIVLAAGSSLLSCQREAVIAPAPTLENRFDDAAFRQQANAHLQEVALMLARSLKDQAVGQLLKQEADKQFDGDYDILYGSIARHTFADGKTLQTKLAESLASPSGRTTAQAEAQLASIAQALPILNIAVPIHAESWNPRTYTPLVAFRPVDYEEATARTVKAFDSEGKLHELDAKQEPAFPVIVVSLNERVDPQGNLLRNLVLVDGSKQARSASGRTTADSRGPWKRDAVNYPIYPETLVSAGFKSMSQLRRYEDWISGRVELQLEILKLDKTVTDSAPFGGRQRDWDHEHVVDITIFTWDYHVNGDRVKYHWTELDDAGEHLEFKISLSGNIYKVGGELQKVETSATLKIDGNDDRIGERTVLFTDGIPGGYDVGQAFRFTTVQY
jgi:hypothetical protein